MAHVDPTFIVGAIREKEKQFLEHDEYVRLMAAPSFKEASRTLVETPYGVWLQERTSLEGVFEALIKGLEVELTWLKNTLDKEKVIQFLTARYDALNIVSALIDLKEGRDSITSFSPLYSISQDALFSALWRNDSWDFLPHEWRAIVQQEHELLSHDDWSKTALFSRMEKHLVDVMSELAFTPLMKRLADITSDHLALDRALRDVSLPSEEADKDLFSGALANAQTAAELVTTLQKRGYATISEDMISELQQGIQSLEYEKAWDTEILRALHMYRLNPSGYDPVISYWFGKEHEVKTLRILFSAKSSGLPNQMLERLRRPYYQYSSL